MTVRAADVHLPAALEFDEYRSHNPDLSEFSDETLAAHYLLYGEAEGRRSNSIGSREAFAALIPGTARSLEIGPFNNPLLRGTKTKYFDVLGQPELVRRANSLNLPSADIPEIDFVSRDGNLAIVNETFEYVLSSHTLEHQPDLIAHLQSVERLLRRGGRYFVLVPDKRYCFDHFIAESSFAEVLAAHREGRKGHTLKSVLGHRILTTHNDARRHWANDHGCYMDDYESRTKAALTEFAESKGFYIDVHAWFFTPTTARIILSALHRLSYTNLELERLYPTRHNSNEFWLTLRK